MTLLLNHRQLLNGSKSFLFLLLFSLSNLLAQDQREFQLGIQSFNSGDFSNAIRYLEKFKNTESKYSETANIILILSYFRLNNFEKAQELIKEFEISYPNSKSLSVILEVRLAIALLKEDFEEVKKSLLGFEQVKISKDQLKDFTNAIKRIFTFASYQQVVELSSLLTNPILQFAFTTVAFENEIEKKNSTAIKNYYKEMLKLGLKNDLMEIKKVGVLIPKENKSGVAENLIIEGLKFAVHRFNEYGDKNIELKIYKGDQKKLEKALIELAKDPEILCVVGPLYSAQFKSLAVLADKLGIPLISPTATEANISIKSKYVFQFNPTLDVRGYAMAHYAINKLKLSRFALLSSNNHTAQSIAKKIREEIKESKCELIVDENWDENKKTLPSKIREIRKAAFKRDFVIRFNSLLDFKTEQKLILFGMSQSTIDSLKLHEAEVSIYEIFGKDAEKFCKLNNIDFYKRTKSVITDLNVPLYSIDAIFIPVTDEKLISEIANEIEKQNIVTKIIGNDKWNTLEELNNAYPSSNGVIFTSDFYIDTNQDLIKELSNEVFEYTKLQANRTFFYGFETANKILENWNHFLDRENFYDKIVADKNYDGISSDIILNKDGVNSSVFILEYRNRKIKKIDRIISN